MAFHHCVHGKSGLWLFLLGPAPFAFCFVSLLDGEAHIWLGDLRFALYGLCSCFVCAFDLPSYMTTGVYVDVILNCFFSCKDRASERDRPYRRKKKSSYFRLGLCFEITWHFAAIVAMPGCSKVFHCLNNMQPAGVGSKIEQN